MFATDYTYLGYSLDTSNIPQPPAHRPPKIWVLAKRVFYFTDGAQPVWNNDWYAQVSDMLQEEFPGFEFVGSFVDDRNEETKKLKGPIEVPKGWDRSTANNGTSKSRNVVAFWASVGHLTAQVRTGQWQW
jgi:hypothetical protein